MRSWPAAAALVLLLAAPVYGIGALQFLGESVLEPGLLFGDTRVGGLSGITYDADRDRYYAVSDDPSSRSPSRFYTLRIDLASGSLAADAAALEAVTILRDRHGEPFRHLVMDAEGIALTPSDTLVISSEGNVREGVPPSIREFDLAGRELRELAIPRRYRPRRRRPFGVRHNQAFEALTWSASGNGFYTANENALRQDGPAADVGQPSAVRILRYDYDSGKVASEMAYLVEPVVSAPATRDGFRTNGLVELLALDGDHLLALERSYSEAVGNSIRLYLISTREATNVRGLKRLQGRKSGGYTRVTKRPLLDLAVLGIRLDNLEGITFGPPLDDGRRTLVLISDDNFSDRQKTQILAFAFADSPPASHRGPDRE